MPLAIRYRENLRGAWYRLSAPEDEHPAAFELASELRVTRLFDGRPAEASGRLHLDGFATDVIVKGRLRADGRTKSLTYAFPFVADDGSRCSLVGQKDMLPVHLPESFFELSCSLHVGPPPGSVLPLQASEVGRVSLRSPPTAAVVELLRTVRLSWAGFA